MTTETAYVLPKAFAGYETGRELRDVTLAEARAMDCNRCGDCCSGMRPDVKKDDDTGLPLFVWGSKFPADLYEARYGERLLQPVGFLDEASELPYPGRIGVVDRFEVDADGKPHTCFSCSMLRLFPEGADGPETGCGLLLEHPDPDPKRLEQLRPRSCGEFPVFGLDVDAAIAEHGYFVPHTGALPRCTWYGIRVTGPWKQEPAWLERWRKQEAGLPVDPLPALDPEKVDAFFGRLLSRRATIDGSRPKARIADNGEE